MSDIKICKSFKFLSEGLEKILNNHLKVNNLSISQGLVLIWLAEEIDNALPIKVIEKKFGKAQSTTLGIIKRLEQKELIVSNITSNRIKIVSITDKGLQLIDFIITTIKNTENSLFINFSEEEKQIFFRLLVKAQDTLLEYSDINKEEFYE